MAWLLAPSLRPYVLMAALASLVINVMVLAPSLFMLQVFDRVFTSGSMETLVMLLLLVALCLGLMTAMDILRTRALAFGSAVLDRRIGPAVLQGLLNASARPGGTSQVHSLRDVALLRGFMSGPGILAVFDAPWLPLYLLVITAFHPLLGLTGLVGALLLFGLIRLNERLSRAGIEAMTQASRKASRRIDQALRNAEVIAGMGMGANMVARWQQANDEVLALQAVFTARQARMQAAVRLLRQALQVVMVAMGAWLVVREHASPGIMVSGSILLSKALSPVEQLVTGWKGLVEARSAWQRLQGAPILAAEEGTELPAPQGRVDVERLVFAFPGRKEALIKGVSFSLEAGTCLGLIGPSGSGKTTLLRLMLGIWAPQSGAVRLDGADIGALQAAFCAEHIGYLPQDVELFAGTVAENIARLGEVDDVKVVAAAQLAGVHELILKLPQGYDTPIGEAGASLSGGQRQRVALARAVYGVPRLLVLDEPNANLDADGEAALAQTLSRLKVERVTVVMVGHRPSMMRSVDMLAVVNDGRIDLFGPRDEVLTRLQGKAA